MKKTNFDLTVQRPKVIWKQVTEQIRDKILKKEWPPGTKLPSTAELAAQSGADVKTIHHALTELVKEGLITRARKIGTYVTERKDKLSTIGIYHPANIHQDPHAQFYQALHDKLQKKATALGIVTRIWVDHRPKHLQTTTLPEMEKAAKNRDIEGVVSSLADPMHLSWLRKFPVPVAFMGADLPSSVTWNLDNLLDITLENLRAQGCRSVGIITPYTPYLEEFLQYYYDQCKALGLKTSPDWVIRPKNEDFSSSCHGTFGYQAFHELWSLKKKPDGLFVFPDGIARGAIMAMMACQVRVPEDLRVVLHKNEEINLFCPLPVTFVVSRAANAAEALLKQLSILYQGKEPKTARLDYKISEKKGGLEIEG